MENNNPTAPAIKFAMTYKEAALANAFFQGIHSWMCPYEIEKIWDRGEDGRLTSHMIQKWKEHEIGDGRTHDVFRWYNSLDLENRKKVIDWYNKKVQL